MCSGIFNENLLQIHCWVRCKKIKPIWLSYRQESWLSQSLCVPGHCPAERWRNHQISSVWLLLTVFTLILTWLRQLSNWRKPILTCNWMLMMCERILLWSLSSLLRQLRTVSYSVSCWVNIFLLANYILLTPLAEYFSTTILCRWNFYAW